jgi:hypothetical protein
VPQMPPRTVQSKPGLNRERLPAAKRRE